jgi:hypothetical protein
VGGGETTRRRRRSARAARGQLRRRRGAAGPARPRGAPAGRARARGAAAPRTHTFCARACARARTHARAHARAHAHTHAHARTHARARASRLAATGPKPLSWRQTRSFAPTARICPGPAGRTGWTPGRRAGAARRHRTGPRVGAPNPDPRAAEGAGRRCPRPPAPLPPSLRAQLRRGMRGGGRPSSWRAEAAGWAWTSGADPGPQQIARECGSTMDRSE